MPFTKRLSGRPHAVWFWIAAPAAAMLFSALPRQGAEVLRPVCAPDAAAAALLFGERLDPNTATSRDLELLPTIGPARAAAIVKHAQQHRFRRIRDLEDIRGIGPKTVDKLAAWLEIHSAVADPSPSAQSSRRPLEAAGRAAAREE